MSGTSFVMRKEKRVFVAHNISESMFVNSGYDFEQYRVKISRATFDDMREAVEESKKSGTLKNLITNSAVLNRLKEMYQIDIPITSIKEKISIQPGDVLYTLSPVERLSLKLYDAEESLPPGIRLKVIKYQIVPE